MLVKGAFSCGDEAETLQRELTSRRAADEVAIRERLRRAKREGDLPADANPADLARYLAMVQEGMSVQAMGGASRKDLHRVVDLVLRAWPGK